MKLIQIYCVNVSNGLMLNKMLKDNNLSDIKNLKKIIRYLMIFTV